MKHDNVTPNSVTDVQTLSRYVVVFHGLSIVAVLLQPTSPAVLLGRYSRTALGVLIALLTATLPLVFGWRWLTMHRDNPRTWSAVQRLGISAMLLVCIAALWTIDTGSTVSYLVVRWEMTFILSALVVWITGWRHVQNVRTRRADRVTNLVVAGIAIVLMGTVFVAATRFPGILWTDEGFNFSLGMNIARTGTLQPTLFADVPPFTAPIYSGLYSVLGGLYRLAGGDFAAGRLLFFACGIAGMVVIASAARRNYGGYTALAAIGIGTLALSPNNFLRADVSVGLYVALASVCYLAAGRVQQAQTARWWHLAVGLFAAFAVDGHPNAYRFAIAFALIYGIECLFASRPDRRQRSIDFMVFAVGAALGLALYIGLYSVIAPGTFLQSLRAPGADETGTPLLGFTGLNAFGLFSEQISATIINAPVLFGFALTGWIAALFALWRNPWRNNRTNNRTKNDDPDARTDRLLVLLPVLSMIILAAMYGRYRGYYLVGMMSIYVLLAMRGLFALSGLVPDSRVAMRWLLVIALAAGLGKWRVDLANRATSSFDEAITVAVDALTLIRPGETTVGIDPMAISFRDDPGFISSETGAIRALRFNTDEISAWKTVSPDNVLLPEQYPAIRFRAALQAYIADQGLVCVRRWTTMQLGQITLYMRYPPSDLATESGCTP